MSSWLSPFFISENDQLSLSNKGLKKVSSISDLTKDGLIIYDNPFNLLLYTNSERIFYCYEEILNHELKS